MLASQRPHLPAEMIEMILMIFSEADSTFWWWKYSLLALQGYHTELFIWQVGIDLVSTVAYCLKEGWGRPVVQKWPHFFSIEIWVIPNMYMTIIKFKVDSDG